MLKNKRLYQRIVGSLLYLSNGSRSGIAGLSTLKRNYFGYEMRSKRETTNEFCEVGKECCRYFYEASSIKKFMNLQNYIMGNI